MLRCVCVCKSTSIILHDTIIVIIYRYRFFGSLPFPMIFSGQTLNVCTRKVCGLTYISFHHNQSHTHFVSKNPKVLPKGSSPPPRTPEAETHMIPESSKEICSIKQT